VFDFLTRTSKTYTPEVPAGAHGGGDDGLAEAFVAAVATGDQARLGVSTDDVLNSHLVVFAAEQARKQTTVVDFAKFKEEAFASA